MQDGSVERPIQGGSRPQVTEPAQPRGVHRWIVRLVAVAAPFFLREELWPSLVRYSAPEPHRARSSWFRNILVSAAMFPAILAHSLWRSRTSRRSEPTVQLVIDAADAEYYERVFAGVAEVVREVGVVRAGSGPGMDRPAPDASVARADAFWLLGCGLVFWPLLTLASLATRTDLVQGFAKSFVVYFRARQYFTRYPCEVFLTYRDNMC